MTVQDNIAIARSQIELYNSHQSDPQWLEKGVAALSEDFELTDVPTGTVSHGSDAFKQFNLFFADAFPESKVELNNIFATEDQAVIEFTGRGTNTGPLHMPTGDVPPTGRQANLQFCQVMQFRNGKITSLRTYYDLMTMLRQLGLIHSQDAG